MSTDTARFVLDLEAKGLKGEAASAASALDTLRTSMERDTKALRGMQTAMRRLKEGGLTEGAQYKKLAAAIDIKKKAIGGLQEQYSGLGGRLDFSARKTRSFADKLKETTDVTSQMRGPLGTASQLVQRFVDVVRKNPMKTAAAMVAAGLTLLGAAVVKYTKQLYDYAVGQQEARRSELLRLEGMTKIRNWYGIAAGSAKDLQAQIDRVSASSALSREQISGMAESLYKAHFRGANLGSALEAMAIKTSTQGSEQASLWLGYAEAINRTGGNVGKFAQRVKNDLGGLAAKQMLSSEVQARKVGEAYSAMTTGVDIEPLLRAKAQFNSMFSQATASGRALKQMVTAIVQPLISLHVKVLPRVQRAFLYVVLAAQEVTIGVLGIAVAARNAAKDIDQLSDFSENVMYSLGAAAGVGAAGVAVKLAPAIAGLGGKALPAALRGLGRFHVLMHSNAGSIRGMFGAMKGGVSTLRQGFLPALRAAGGGLVSIGKGALEATKGFAKFAVQAVKSAIQGLVRMVPILIANAATWGMIALEVLVVVGAFAAVGWAIYELVKNWDELGESLSYVGGQMLDAGKDIMKGLLHGLGMGWDSVVEFFKNLGPAMVQTLRKVLGIASPSKVFAGIGQNIGAGLQAGIDMTAPDVEQSVQHLVDVPSSTALAAGTAAAGSSITIGAININSSAKTGRGMAEEFRRELRKVLQQSLAEMGARA